MSERGETGPVWLITHPSRGAALRARLEEGGALEVRVAALGGGEWAELSAAGWAALNETTDEPAKVLVDGETLLRARERRELLRALRRAPGVGRIVFVCARPTRLDERADAELWADEVLEGGWTDEQGLRTWLRSSAHGRPQLRLLPGGEQRPRPHIADDLSEATRAHRDGDPPHAEFPCESGVSFDVAVAAELIQRGQQAGIRAMQDAAEQLVEQLLEEIEHTEASLNPAALEELEQAVAGQSSPIAAARFGGARGALEMYREQLRRACRQQLEALGPSEQSGERG